MRPSCLATWHRRMSDDQWSQCTIPALSTRNCT
jgi:hypothetical protein